MAPLSRIRGWWDRALSIGGYPGEPASHRGRRRIVVGYMIIGIPPRLLFGAQAFAEGMPVSGWIELIAALIPAIGLVVLTLRPSWYVAVVNVILAGILFENLAATVVVGGLVPSNMLMAFGFVVVVGALIALDGRAGLWWFLAYLVAVILAVVLPERIEPIYEIEGTSGDIAGVLASTAILVYGGMAYFVRQRDRFQQQSDDLLHNMLPDPIAERLKASDDMIADSYQSASVLFADVVDFTPMSAGMSPNQLVGLLNEIFSSFDAIVSELGLEKIKTVGDEYMVASGVPTPREDHAQAAAELALRIRDHLADNEFEGHRISMRIGINSGPVVAGVIGTHKFSYDLWGDVVNTASRMESEGVEGAIQISEDTCEQIKNDFVCDYRGEVKVKGKGQMPTYILESRRTR